jgi:hypothetical protein
VYRGEHEVKDFNRKAQRRRQAREGSDSLVSLWDLCVLYGSSLFLFLKKIRFACCAKSKFMASSNIFLRKDARIGGFHN